MLMGAGWAILGLIITAVTFVVSPGGYVVVAYGAMLAGGIQFVVGLAQFISYQAKSPQGKQQADAEATIQAILQAMLATCVADGRVRDEEVEAIRAVALKLFGQELEVDQIRVTATGMLNQDVDVYEVIAQRRAMIDESLRRMIFRAALFVAAADGDVDEREREILGRVAAGLALTESQLDEILSPGEAVLPAQHS
jgi:uncharacterized tellurite resistance protein B-like protein